MPQECNDETIVSFRDRLRSCVAATGGHVEHTFNTELAADIPDRNVRTVDETRCTF